MPGNTPLSVWRARDGWLLVSTSGQQAWRDFCATFLSLAAYRNIPAAKAWESPWINEFATTVLDTHKVEDAVGTCLTYGVPAAPIPAWQDSDRPGASKALADQLAWAALIIQQ